MSLQILCQYYKKTETEKPLLVKLKVIFMRKVIKTKSKRFPNKEERKAWVLDQQEKILEAYNTNGTKGLMDYMGIK